MTDPMRWIDDELNAWSQEGLTRQLRPHGAAAPGRFVRDGREFINFGANDYLGLATDPRLLEAAWKAGATFGWGAGASPLVSGWTDLHEELVTALARFEQTEAALLFPTGYAANAGTIAALVGPGDAVYADRLNHACLFDGARLSGARLRPFANVEVDRLATLLARDRGRFRRSLIVTDGVFSMDGHLAPLAKIADLAEQHQSMLLVDEAHGTGVFGTDGRGACSACGVAERVPIRVGTLSKALGGLGGFVAGSKRLIDWLTNHARTLIYSTALPTPVVAASHEALRIVESEPWRREHVLELSARLCSRLTELDLKIGSSQGPIIPILLGTPERATSASERLAQNGLFVPAIRPPTVPKGTARLRISLSAAHSQVDVDALVAVLKSLPRVFDPIT